MKREKGERKKQKTGWRPKSPAGFLLIPSDRWRQKYGAAARLAEVRRATALVFDDLGQRIKLVPLPE